MKKTNRSAAVAFVAGISLFAAACGSSASTASTGSTGGTSGGSSGGSGSKTATLIMSTLNNPFFVSVKDGAQAEAARKGISLDVENANNSDETALNLATTAITKKPGILIIDPVGSESGTSMVKSANQASVPVMAFDRQPDGGNLATFVGYDAIQAGKNSGLELAKALGGKGKIVDIQGTLGTNVAQDRDKGFLSAISAYPGISVVATQTANFDRSTALDVMTNILQAHPDINGVYAANDEMALGVLAALKSRNLAGQVKLVGNDGISDALAAINSGDMVATNAESAYALGEQVIDLALDVIDGKSVAKDTVLQGEIVTKANVATYGQHLTSIGDSADVPAGLKP